MSIKLYFCLVICVALSLPSDNEAARILVVIPIPSISHQVVFRPLTQELAKRGHEVTVVTTDPAFPKGQTPTNLIEIDIHDVTYGPWKKLASQMKLGHKEDHYNQAKILFNLGSQSFEALMNHPEVQDIVKNKRDYFDLLLLEACVMPVLGLTHVFKVPVILVSSFGAVVGNYDVLGAPTHPLLYPHNGHIRLYNLTFWEKIRELYNHYSKLYLLIKNVDENNQMLKRLLGPDTPPIPELASNVDMLFLNMHPIWEGNTPVPPSVIHMWGIHTKPEKVLPQDLKSYLDSSKNGVIYMSFGSNAQSSMLPPEKIQTFIKVFSQLPFDVLWKWDKDELPGKSKNIKISKWLPQSDLLKHPKIKLFITQAGLQSADETIIAGVPVVCIPMFGDQWYNAEKFVHHKIGVQLELEDLNEETFRKAIDTVTGDRSYRDNIVKLRSLMSDQKEQPLERVVWWTEHVLRHGSARHLRAPAANMAWREYFELDLVFTLLMGLLCFSAIFVSVIYYLYSSLFVVKKLKTS